MNCRKAERWLLKSADGRLDRRDADLLARHLEGCPGCRKAERDYRTMFALLADGRTAEPRPGFWARLEPRLQEEREIVPLLFWERLSLRAIPVFLVLVALIGGVLILTPQARETSASAALLLDGQDPLSDVHAQFDADRPEAKSMRLMFASLDDKTPARRPRP